MPRRTTAFVCSTCGHHESKWLGQCPSCGEWNTLEERSRRDDSGRSHPHRRGSPRTGEGPPALDETSLLLSEINAANGTRVTTGMSELDRALGGGLMPGSTILVGGQPGIGKSTLMLQTAGSISPGPVLYVSGEESAAQLRQRAGRLAVSSEAVHILCTGSLDLVLDELRRLQPRLVIVDSVQTMIAPDAGSVPGTINQIKYVTHELAEWNRENQSNLFLVAHVTKEGQIAGPKVVEHMVDAVLLFEHSGSDLRFLRATKNRFGAIEEVGLFTMEHTGLVELSDPGRVFLSGRPRGETPPGVIAAPCYEGSRVLLVEIQALTVPAKGAVSRTFSDRIDNRRVSRVAAVLEKHGAVRFSDQDIYVNVAGGIRIQDVAIDLALAIALYSARQGVAVPSGTVATGELSLAGEIRPISHRTQRLRAGIEMGFDRVIGPPDPNGTPPETDRTIWVPAASLPAAIKVCF